MELYDQYDLNKEINEKIRDRKLKNAVVKAIRKNQIEGFMVKVAIASITAAYAANAYTVIGDELQQQEKKKAMKVVTEQDYQILNDKNNHFEGLIDAQGYPRGWGYNHCNIGKKINEFYAVSKDLGDIHLADIADIILYDDDNQNIDKVFNWVDDKYVGDAKNFKEYYQSLGFESEEQYYDAMVDLNYKLNEEQKDLGGPKL